MCDCKNKCKCDVKNCRVNGGVPEGLEPFDLERALAGDKVVTSSGKEVTQLHMFKDTNSLIPLVGVCDKAIHSFNIKGVSVMTGKNLRMAPKVKKYAWAALPENVAYRSKHDSSIFYTGSNPTLYKHDPLGVEHRISNQRSGRYILLQNPIQPWFGGECPVPEGTKIRVWFREGDNDQTCVISPNAYRWSHSENSRDIIHYQILGMDEGYE